MGIREVWFFHNNQFEIYHLRGDTYEVVSQSELLGNLDLQILAQYYAVANDPLDAALEFREKIEEMVG